MVKKPIRLLKAVEMKKIIKKTLIYSAYLGLIVIIFGSLSYFSQDIFTLFKHLNWKIISLLTFLHIPLILLYGLGFEEICKAFKYRLRWMDWVGLSFITNFLNQLLPYRPGLAFRYFYLRKHYHIPTQQFVFILLTYLSLMLLVSAVFILIGGIYGHLPIRFSHMLWIGAGLLVGLTLLVLWFYRGHIKSETHPKWAQWYQMGAVMLTQPFLIGRTSLIFMAMGGLNTLIFFLILSALHVPLPWLDCIFLVGVMFLAMIVPITPGNIGLLETLMGTFTQIFYHNFGLGFAAIALYRVTQWIPSAFFGILFSFLLAGSIIPPLQKLKVGSLKVD